jgi:16S rRNA (guanine1207-N2)-methyltransferase
MTDPAFDVLLMCLHEPTAVTGTTLWVADEQALEIMPSLAGSPNVLVISNRIDVVQAAEQAGVIAQFSDFDFSALANSSIARVIYRLSKEKPVVHHVLNEAARLLAPGGELFFAGFKNEGTKTYRDKARELFGHADWQKNSTVYLASFVQPAVRVEAGLLETQNYAQLRLMETENETFYSKPGVFGWNKIDRGSAFLVEHLLEFLALLSQSPSSLLDLGCGYGYLTAHTRNWPLVRRVATDNNAGAIVSATKTAQHYGISVDVLADDCGRSLQEKFDVILCNPPFHQGFRTEDRLTKTFLQQTQRLLTSQGAALFVVNMFIPLESAAEAYFHSVQTLANNGSFKLVVLQQPRYVR